MLRSCGMRMWLSIPYSECLIQIRLFKLNIKTKIRKVKQISSFYLNLTLVIWSEAQFCNCACDRRKKLILIISNLNIQMVGKIGNFLSVRASLHTKFLQQPTKLWGFHFPSIQRKRLWPNIWWVCYSVTLSRCRQTFGFLSKSLWKSFSLEKLNPACVSNRKTFA